MGAGAVYGPISNQAMSYGEAGVLNELHWWVLWRRWHALELNMVLHRQHLCYARCATALLPPPTKEAPSIPPRRPPDRDAC